MVLLLIGLNLIWKIGAKDPAIINISVLQGTILGPLLFLCYINDLPLSTDLLTFLFADDTTCLATDTHLPSLINRVNLELQKLANWFRDNKIAVNTLKTKFILFHTKGKPVNIATNSFFYNVFTKSTGKIHCRYEAPREEPREAHGY